MSNQLPKNNDFKRLLSYLIGCYRCLTFYQENSFSYTEIYAAARRKTYKNLMAVNVIEEHKRMFETPCAGQWPALGAVVTVWRMIRSTENHLFKKRWKNNRS